MNEQFLKRYLLGQLPAEEQRRLEEQFFSDAQAFERLLVLEDDLIDDYVCGDLSRKQRERFEKHFLISQERRERLSMARALVTAIPPRQKTVAAKTKATPWWELIFELPKLESPAIRYTLVAASFFILTFYGTRETLENKDLRRQVYQLENRQEVLRQSTEEEILQAWSEKEKLQLDLESLGQQIAQQAQQLRLLEPKPYVLKSAATTRGGTTGEQLEELQVDQGGQWIKLQLEFDKDINFRSYRAVLQSYPEGKEIIWSQSQLKAQLTDAAKVVSVILPATIFTQVDEPVQEYKLTLLGTDSTQESFRLIDYPFRIMKE